MSTPTIALEALRAVRGRVIGRDDPGYEDARAVHNSARGSRPEVVVQCVDAADVVAALHAAEDAGLPVAVRGGGHSAAGHSSVEDGLVIDLGPMRHVQVDPGARLARVGGGATAGDLDHATSAFGLATPTATVSTVGVAGFTLGGGISYLSRAHGLALDNLVGADVVLADGSLVRAGSGDGEDRDLLWALRGGGANVGVVTELRLRLHEVGIVNGGPMFFDLDDTDRVVRRFREWIGTQDADVYAFLALLGVPPDAPLPEAVRGRPVCALVWCNTAPVERSRRVIDDFRAGVVPLFDGVAELPFPVLQAAFDAGAARGTHSHLCGVLFEDLPDEAVPRFRDFAAAMPTGLCQSHLYPMDGAAARPAGDETAWPWRDASFAQMMVGAAAGPDAGPAVAGWATGFRDALSPFAMAGCYVNFMMDDVADPAGTAYGPNLARLVELKRRYDPGNVFHRNVNVSPDGATR